MAASRSSADLALVGGRVRTLDPERPFAEALAIRDGTIVAVGSDAEVRAACDAATEVVDLAGAVAVPGLTDSHQHPFLGTADTAGAADLTGLRTLPEVLDALRAQRARVENGGWVRGYALQYEAFAEVGIHGRVLQEALGDVPAYVTFMDFHTAVASPAALRLAGLDGPRSFTEAAEVVCADGVPTGELREMGAMSLVTEAIPAASDQERLDSYPQTFARQHALGVTGVHVMLGSPALLDACRQLEAEERLTMRLLMTLHQPPEVTDDEVEEQLRMRDAAGRRWRGGVAKFFIDGVVESGTAWLEEPDRNGGGTRPFWPDPARFAELVRRFAGAGFAISTHAIGDRAIRETLDAYRAAGAAPGVMHRIEHVETAPDETIARFAREGVAASMQPIHMESMQLDRQDPWSLTLGPERNARAFRTGDLLRSGALLALGSDWPVARYDPRLGMAWSRLRREPGRRGEPGYGADQVLDGLATLEGYTTAPARLAGLGDRLGRLREGYLADVTVLAADPVDTDADDLPDVPVVLTIVDGEIVFRGEQ